MTNPFEKRVRNVRMLVWELEMSTVLLCSDLLKHVFFSSTTYLAGNYEPEKYSEVAAKGKACLFTGFTYW